AIFARQQLGSVQGLNPAAAQTGAWQREVEPLVVAVEEQVKAVILDAFAADVQAGDSRAIQEDAERLGKTCLPVLVGELPAVRLVPADLPGGAVPDGTILEPQAPVEYRMIAAKPDEPAGEGQQIDVGSLPVEPGQLVVLAVGIVVALLRAADLVAAEQHGDALRQEQRGQEVALLPGPKLIDGRVRGGPFSTAVPRAIVG